MYAVTIREYGDESNLNLEQDIPVPEPKSNQVLIKVKASSVNPIDLMKRAGYGRTIFEKQRKHAHKCNTRLLLRRLLRRLLVLLLLLLLLVLLLLPLLLL